MSLQPSDLLTLDISLKTTRVLAYVTETTPPSFLLARVDEPGSYSEECVGIMNFPHCYLLYNAAVLLRFDTIRSL